MEKLIRILSSKSFLVLGVGNTDRGDDGIGNYVLSRLKTVHKLDCGPVPENFTGKVRKLAPEIIIIIDAVDFGGKPGEWKLTEAENAVGVTLSTHSLPLSFLCKMLPDSRIYLFGIQPESLESMTETVRASGDRLAAKMNRILK